MSVLETYTKSEILKLNYILKSYSKYANALHHGKKYETVFLKISGSK
jgi:hypothetical protein